MLGSVALDLLAATEAAAVAAAGWRGRGDGRAADAAAVEALRTCLASVPIDGTVVIGEGEKDAAPMLYNGERVGRGSGPKLDLAVDPLECTKALACGGPNSLAVLGAAPRGALWSPGPAYYMEKLAVGAGARDAIDISATPADNVSAVAKALGKEVSEVGVFVLDKPRHDGLIAELREAGARVRLAPDGDVLGALLAALPDTDIDLLMGIGGTPEGVLAACALRVLGGAMQCRLSPQRDDEARRIAEAGIDTAAVLELDDLVASDEALFAATGITGGDLLGAVARSDHGPVTQSLLIGPAAGKTRLIRALHVAEPSA
jgi:fructose-1,6-bisphosphatase II